jgi:hypothetical protein
MLVTTEVVKNLEKKQTITYQTVPVLYQFFHENCWFIQVFELTGTGSFFIQIFFFIIILILKYLGNQNQQI